MTDKKFRTVEEILKGYMPQRKAFNQWQLRIEPDVKNVMQEAQREPIELLRETAKEWDEMAEEWKVWMNAIRCIREPPAKPCPIRLDRKKEVYCVECVARLRSEARMRECRENAKRIRKRIGQEEGGCSDGE